MKRITTTFFICLLLGITSLHAERDNHTQRTPEKQPEFITGFRYLPPGFECFADMFKYKVIDFPGFSTQDTLYFKKYTRPIKGYTVKEIHALNGNRCNAYVLCFEKGNKKFFVGGCGYGYPEICIKDRTRIVEEMDSWGFPGGDTITPHSFKRLKESQDSLCHKAYNLHFDSAKKYTEYGHSRDLTFCFTDIDVDGQDELIIFAPYYGTCGFRIYDIQETPRKLRLKSISKTDFDHARILFIAPKEGVLLVWWRAQICKFKILKNTAGSITKFKLIDHVNSESCDYFFAHIVCENRNKTIPDNPAINLLCIKLI